MSITREQIEHVATLARLELSEEEIALFTPQMNAILAYVATLSQLDTEAVVATSHAVPMENAFRTDAVAESLGIDRALANAPERVENFFRVPKVIE